MSSILLAGLLLSVWGLLIFAAPQRRGRWRRYGRRRHSAGDGAGVSFVATGDAGVTDPVVSFDHAGHHGHVGHAGHGDCGSAFDAGSGHVDAGCHGGFDGGGHH